MKKLTDHINVAFTEINGRTWVGSKDFDKLYDFAIELEKQLKELAKHTQSPHSVKRLRELAKKIRGLDSACCKTPDEEFNAYELANQILTILKEGQE